jgi:hypothetical protein
MLESRLIYHLDFERRMDKLGRWLQADEKLRILAWKVLGSWSRVRRDGFGGMLWVKASMYRRQLRREQYAPYPLRLYERLVRLLTTVRGQDILRLSDLKPSQSSCVVLRHDIDTERCIHNLPAIVSVEKGQKVFSTVLFRVDGQEYDPTSCAELANSLREEGFDVGLHSLAYLSADSDNQLSEEIEQFRQAFGFLPNVYNFHGLGTKFLGRRMQLCANADRILNRYSFLKGTDSYPGFYVYRIQDSHGLESKRFILSDFISPPMELISAGRVLVLTHPAYWDTSQ